MAKKPRKIPGIWSDNPESLEPFDLFQSGDGPGPEHPPPPGDSAEQPPITPVGGDEDPAQVFRSPAGDLTLAGSGALALDVNRDGQDDVLFEYQWLEGDGPAQRCLIVSPRQGVHFMATPMSEGDTLSPTAGSWREEPLILVTRQMDGALSRWDGQWARQKTHLALRLPGEDGAYLAHIHLSIDAKSGHLVIHHYAHSVAANQTLEIGKGPFIEGAD